MAERDGRRDLIRELRAADYPAVAALYAIVMPEAMPPTEAGIRHWFETEPERARFRAWVAEEDGELVGLALGGFHWTTSAPGVAWLWAGVRPEARGRGLGTALCGRAEAHLLAHGARKLETFALEGSDGERFAKKGGYRRTRTELVQRLDPSEADLAAIDALAAEKEREGFRLAPLRDLGDRRRELHAVYAAASADIPADDPEDDVSYDDWERQDLHDPELSWDGSFVVLAAEKPVALAFLKYNHELGLAENEMTGTLPDFRGRGLARLAKLATIRWAAEHGIREISTENDGENVAMRTLNESLGYRVQHVRAFFAREP